jgi:hypothetical protein
MCSGAVSVRVKLKLLEVTLLLILALPCRDPHFPVSELNVLYLGRCLLVLESPGKHISAAVT